MKSIYSIQKCEFTDINKVVWFIDNYWKKGHALVTSRKLMDFQHYNKMYNNYNFIIAKNINTGEVDAIMGYIPTSQYDYGLDINGDYWPAIWGKRNDVNNQEIKEIGNFLTEAMYDFPNFKSFASIGISPIVRKMHKISGFATGILNHYYLTNYKKSFFQIAKNVTTDIVINEINKPVVHLENVYF